MSDTPQPDPVQATARRAPPLLVLELRGEVTATADAPLRAAYDEVAGSGLRHILLDFSGVDYVNSAGIAAVIGLLTAARRDERRVLVTGLNDHYRKIFEMMGLTQFAPLVADEAAARRAAGA
jgi:anti-anti-sigma factor